MKNTVFNNQNKNSSLFSTKKNCKIDWYCCKDLA
jgi:hypothetical protein